MFRILLSPKYKKCYSRVCFVVLLLISIHSWWYFYQVNDKSHFVKSFFGLTNSHCTVQYPRNDSLQFSNKYWQVLNTSKCSVSIFGAYLDIRDAANKMIRFTSMFSKLNANVRLYAQVWHNPKDVKVSATSRCELRLMWHLKWGIKSSEFPFLVSCRLRDDLDWRTIVAASLVENICDVAHNRLIIRTGVEVANKSDFGICVKGLNINHTKLTIRLIEWIELMHLLGAHKIYFYELTIHSQLKKLLRYYVDKRKVSVVPISVLPSSKHRNNILAKRHNEMIVYNDCFYKHHSQYKYIVLLDIDEVIVPTTLTNWQDLFKTLRARFKPAIFPTINSICVRNIYFLDKFRGTTNWFQGIPSHMHMLQYVYRQKNFSRVGFYTKCFHSTQSTVILHNHFSFACDNKCLYHHLDVKLAQLNHYRGNCHESTTIDCDRGKKQLVMDFGLWKYKEKLIQNVAKVVKDLGFNFF